MFGGVGIYLDCIHRVHCCMFLRGKSQNRGYKGAALETIGHTAIPAKAPAAMFWSREKLGGRDS